MDVLGVGALLSVAGASSFSETLFSNASASRPRYCSARTLPGSEVAAAPGSSSPASPLRPLACDIEVV